MSHLEIERSMVHIESDKVEFSINHKGSLADVYFTKSIKEKEITS